MDHNKTLLCFLNALQNHSHDECNRSPDVSRSMTKVPCGQWWSQGNFKKPSRYQLSLDHSGPHIASIAYRLKSSSQRWSKTHYVRDVEMATRQASVSTTSDIGIVPWLSINSVVGASSVSKHYQLYTKVKFNWGTFSSQKRYYLLPRLVFGF